MLAEIILWWIQKFRKINTLCVYAKKETVEGVFQDRFRPSLYEVPDLKKLWSGNPDDLTIKKLILNGSIIRLASARVRDDIATFSSGHIYLSELAKYREVGFDVVKLARGRQEAYTRTLNKTAVFESSPLEVGDPLYKEMNKPGVLNLEWFWPCPHCGKYQMYLFDQENQQIAELPNKKGEFDHDPERIRRDNAAVYECLHCEKEIREETRIKNNERGVWARGTDTIDQQGNVLNEWPKADTVSFHWNRLIDFSFKWSECLARYFEAYLSGNPIALKDFLNEDMAQFWEPKIKEYASQWLKPKCGEYKITDETIPNGVLVVLCGIDTQDDRFYYVLRGFGAGKESWLLDCGEVACDMKEQQNKDVVLKTLQKAIEGKKLLTKDGRLLSIRWGFIDRGGHKLEFVDYIAQNIYYLAPYIGATERFRELIKQSEKNDWYLGNTEEFSRMVANDVELDNWHLPQDIPDEYCKQFVRQFDKEKIEKDGSKTRKWHKGGDDHFRDCENYIQAALIISEVGEMLFDQEAIERLKIEDDKEPDAKPVPQQSNQWMDGIQARWRQRIGR
jgi:phage terminase large subunit GpA-like protein